MKTSRPLSGILRIFLGCFLIIIVFVASLTDSPEDFNGSVIEFYSYPLVFSLLGVLLIVFGIKARNRSKRFKKYAALISSEHMTYVQNLADATSQSPDFVRKDLQTMINKNFFKNASLNLNSDELVFGTLAEIPLPQATKKTSRKTLNCPGFSSITAKIRILLGSVLFLLFGLLQLVPSTDNSIEKDSAYYIIAISFSVIGLLLLISGVRAIRRIKRFNKYVALIASEHMTSIQSIASANSKSFGFVRKDLQTMINKKFFKNASLNLNSGEIVFGQKGKAPINLPTGKIEMELINCPGCGAFNSKTKGIKNNCEYCGTSLE